MHRILAARKLFKRSRVLQGILVLIFAGFVGYLLWPSPASATTISGASQAICSPGACSSGTAPDGTSNTEITLNNINNGSVNQTRTYGYYVPTNLLHDGTSQGKPAAVFDLGRQGCNGNGEKNEFLDSNIQSVADSNNFIVIELVCTSTGSNSWLHPETDCGGAAGVIGAGTCDSTTVPSDNPYIKAAVADAVSRFHLDSSRLYLVGGSSGANMARDAICSTSQSPHNSTLFRGIMTMGGGANALYGTTSGVCPSGDKSTFWLELMGKTSVADPYNTMNIPSSCTSTCDHTILGFDSTRNWWASYLGGCQSPAHTMTGSGVLSDVYDYNGCTNTANAASPFFEAVAVTNGGHMWCGLDSSPASNCGVGSHNTGGWSTASYMWNFFSNTLTTVPDTTPPTVSITAPSNGATVSGSAVTVSANASDDVAVAGVQFKLDGSNLGSEDTTNPYSISWDTTGVGNGSHTLTAVARDAAGNTTTSTSVTVTVNNNPPPTVSITAPSDTATVSGATTVTASATDNSGSGLAGVQFKLDGSNLSSEDTTNPYSISWDTTTATDGSHTLTATARDNNGDTATSSTITVTVNNPAPTVSLSATPGTIATGGSSSLTWTTTNSPTSCTASGAWSGSQATSNNTGLTVSPGSTSTYTLTCSNASGTSTPSSATVTVIPVPSVNITAPLNDSTVNGTTTITATAATTTPATIHDVQFQIDGTNIASCDPTTPTSGTTTSGTYSCTTWNTAVLLNGSHTIKAIVTDSLSQTANTTITLTTNNVCSAPSTPTGLAETGNTYTTISLSWNPSTPDSSCTISSYNVFRNGSQVGTVTTNLGSPSYTDTGLTASTNYSYTVQAVDDSTGASAQSGAASLPTKADDQAPTAPTGLALTLDGAAQIDLNWSASTDNPSPGGIGIQNYKVYRALVTNGNPGTYNQIGTSSGTATTYQDSTVSNNPATAYSYRLVAVDNANNPSANSAAVGTTTSACSTSGGTTTCDVSASTTLSSTTVIVSAQEIFANDGTVCNTTVASNGIVKGDGTFCDLIVQSGAIVAPGHSPGCLTVTGNLTENGSYQAEIQQPGTTACTDYDQIIVTGNVDLTGGSLDTELLNSFAPTVGQSFEIINNQGGNPVTGTFSGVAEGAVFAIGNTKLQITYKGGDGNDVVVTVVNPSTPVTAVASLKAPDTGFGLIAANSPVVTFETSTVCAAALFFIAKRLTTKSAKK